MQLSIITINRNHLTGLEATFKSVLAQTCQDFEFIVIDGASSDGSAEFLELNKGRTDYCISEADTGIYNAMNKGIRQAHGEYCLFMNSGDVFYDEKVVENVLSYLDGTTDIIIGESINPNGFIHKMPQEMQFKYFWPNSLPHQASFIARKLFDLYGYYREDYRSASDLFFFFETIFIKKISYKPMDVLVCSFEGGGISELQESQKEIFHYTQHHMPAFYRIYVYLLIWYAPLVTWRNKLKTLFFGKKCH